MEERNLWRGFSTRNGWKCSLQLWKFETVDLRFGCNARRGNEQRVLRDLGHWARRGENMWENCRHSTPETIILNHLEFRHFVKFRKKNLEIIKINSQFFFPCHSCLSCYERMPRSKCEAAKGSGTGGDNFYTLWLQFFSLGPKSQLSVVRLHIWFCFTFGILLF